MTEQISIDRTVRNCQSGNSVVSFLYVHVNLFTCDCDVIVHALAGSWVLLVKFFLAHLRRLPCDMMPCKNDHGFAGTLTTDKSEDCPWELSALEFYKTTPPWRKETIGNQSWKKSFDYSVSSYVLQISGELKSGVWTANWVHSVGGLRGWRMGVLPSFQNTKQVVFSGAGG